MNAEVYFRRSPEVAARKFGDELMIMSGKTSALFSLNATASLLWQAADGKTPLSEAVEREICAQFDVDPAEAMADATEVLSDLVTHGIVEVSSQPAPGNETPHP